MVMFKPELVSNDEIRVNNSGCSTVIVLNCLVKEKEITIKITFVIVMYRHGQMTTYGY